METCPVCLEEPAACRTKCGHEYCTLCISKVLECEAVPFGRCPLCRQGISLYSIVQPGRGKVKSAEVDGPAGCVFTQRGGVGVASYHFETGPDGSLSAFINYAQAITLDWRLDSGKLMPERKYFTHVEYDPSTRRFQGRIDWSPDTVRDHAEWVYDFSFSESFNCIQAGKVVSLFEDGTQDDDVISFPNQLKYHRLKKLPEQLWNGSFVQVTHLGAHANGSLVGIASYHFDSPDCCYINYSNAPPCWQLDNGERPPTRKYFRNTSYDPEARIFCGTVEWKQGFDGDRLWVYEITFTEDFDSISGGTVVRYDHNGDEKGCWKYIPGDATLKERLSNLRAMSYVRFCPELAELEYFSRTSCTGGA